MQAGKFAEFIGGVQISTTVASQLNPDMSGQLRKKNLFVLFLMAVLSQSFFTLVRRNFMTLPFLTTRHTQVIF